MNRLFLLTLFSFLSASLLAQDTLPKFDVKNVGANRVIVGWVNTYGLVKQISIQRSHDSLKNYTTILSVTDPNARQNGYADTKAPKENMFYRLFVVLDKGQYFFTQPKRPFLDTMRLTKSTPVIKESVDNGFRGTITKKPDFVPSYYVYTNKDGYVFINLPDADRKKYHIKFFEDDDSFIFEIKTIREPALTLDKTNFMHSGWFKFELYSDEKLVEKNKFYLSKEF